MSRSSKIFLTLIGIFVLAVILESIILSVTKQKNPEQSTKLTSPKNTKELTNYELNVTRLPIGYSQTALDGSAIKFVGKLVRVYAGNNNIFADILLAQDKTPMKFLLVDNQVTKNFALFKQNTYKFFPLSKETKVVVLDNSNTIDTLKTFQNTPMVFSIAARLDPSITLAPSQQKIVDYIPCNQKVLLFLQNPTMQIPSCVAFLNEAHVYVKNF